MVEGRDVTHARRKEQAERVAASVNTCWKRGGYNGNFVVPGDLNDYPEGATSLAPLLDHPGLSNVLTRLPAVERWTHYHAGGNEYRQLDYPLWSKGLAQTKARAGRNAPRAAVACGTVNRRAPGRCRR